MRGAGDVNADGFADVIIGAPFANEGGVDCGASYVVFGKASGFAAGMGLVGLDGTNGFKLVGAVSSDFSGFSVSAAGDVNGDGFGDLTVGATDADEGGTNRGAGYVVFGFGTAEVTVATGGRSATFTDWDGDLVTIKSTKGPLTASQFHLSSPNPLTGGAHLIYADFTAGAGFAKANLSFTAKRGPTGGDGLVNLGKLDALGVALGKVSVDGDLREFDADSAAGLTVYSLGQFATDATPAAQLISNIAGKLGALTVKTDASRVTLAAQTFGAIKVLNLDDVKIFAAGVLNPAKAANATAIKSLTVTGSVKASHILAGYDATGAAVNADVQIGAVKVTGQWIASDLVAGVRAGDDGIFATGDANETLIPGGNAIVAKIASITIKGAAFGTVDNLTDGDGERCDSEQADAQRDAGEHGVGERFGDERESAEQHPCADEASAEPREQSAEEGALDEFLREEVREPGHFGVSISQSATVPDAVPMASAVSSGAHSSAEMAEAGDICRTWRSLVFRSLMKTFPSRSPLARSGPRVWKTRRAMRRVWPSICTGVVPRGPRPDVSQTVMMSPPPLASQRLVGSHARVITFVA